MSVMIEGGRVPGYGVGVGGVVGYLVCVSLGMGKWVWEWVCVACLLVA